MPIHIYIYIYICREREIDGVNDMPAYILHIVRIWYTCDRYCCNQHMSFPSFRFGLGSKRSQLELLHTKPYQTRTCHIIAYPPSPTHPGHTTPGIPYIHAAHALLVWRVHMQAQKWVADTRTCTWTCATYAEATRGSTEAAAAHWASAQE